MVAVFLLAAALAVKQDGTPLRSGCETSDEVIATVKAGSLAQIRFAIAGTCYKVSVVSEGKALEGYVSAGSLDGIEAFDRGVRSAPAVMSSARAPQPGAAAVTAGHPLAEAASLLDQRQPAAALEAAEQAMKLHGRHYQVLVLAGVAAERADQPKLALDYLREAERLQPDRGVEQFIARLEKTVAGDKSSERLYGNRFLLRYEGGVVDPEIARSVVALLEQEVTHVASELGCRTDERIVTVVQSPQAYRASSDVAEWSGGHFDGQKIRIPLGESNGISARTRETFAHELVHACLANLGQFPTWLHEGMAQRLSGRSPTTAQRTRIRSLLRARRLPRLENMSQSWSRLSAQHALDAYSYANIAVETFYEMYSSYGIQNVLRNPERFGSVTAAIDKRLAE